MTNYEKIKAMSVERMAMFLFRALPNCNNCPAEELCRENLGELCSTLLEKWLLQEAEE